MIKHLKNARLNDLEIANAAMKIEFGLIVFYITK